MPLIPVRSQAQTRQEIKEFQVWDVGLSALSGTRHMGLESVEKRDRDANRMLSLILGMHN